MAQFYNCKGFNFNDFDLIVKNNILYATYVKKIPHKKGDIDSKKPNRYGLAKSKDGIHWEEVGDIIMQDKNSWDQSLWAGSVSKQNKKYVIYYTGVLEKEREPSCNIGKAYSKDLINWKKDSKNPVLIFDNKNPYYFWDEKLAFRDPFFFEHEGKKYILFCAKDKSKPEGKRGCVGIVEETSPNKFKWLPPIFSPEERSGGLECPALYFIKGRWYLLYGWGVRMRYAFSKKPFEAFSKPKNNILLPKGNYIGRIIEFKGKLLYYNWFMDYPKGIVRQRLSGPRKVKILKNGEIKLSKVIEKI